VLVVVVAVLNRYSVLVAVDMKYSVLVVVVDT
jgi:hypothetical protein